MNREMWLSDKNQEPYADRNCALCIDTTALFYTKIVENKYRQPEARIQHLLLPRLYKIGFGSVLVFRKFANPNHDHDTLLCNISQLNLAIPDNIRCIQWQDGSDTNEYEVTESGTYYVSGYNNRGCLVSDTIRIKMGNIPQPVISRSGDSLYSDTGSYTYLWYHNGVAIGNNDPFIHINQTGNYQVEVTDSLGCTATSSLFSVTVLSIKTAENTQVRLFPNPIREGQLLTIDADEELKSIIIYDVHGKIVYQKSEIGSHTTEIRMSNRGIFFIRINRVVSSKIIVK